MTVLHPRPRLTRPRWTDLCGQWEFAHDDDNIGLTRRWHASAEAFDQEITVPYPPESARSGVAAPGPHPVVWYRRTFRVAESSGQRLLLHFGAVDYEARVWVNDVLVATHTGGHTPFSADITSALLPGDVDQVVVVRAADPLDDPEQPRGKQDWQVEPHGIWYHRTTGIWQPVWLEPVAALHVAELQLTPDLAGARVGLEAQLSAPAGAATRVEVLLRLGEEVLAQESYRVSSATLRSDVGVPALRHGTDVRRLLWSPESPTLIDVEVRLYEGQDLVDEVRSYVGLRSVRARDGRFLLNGQPYFLRMVLEQGYWPESHLAAPDEDALRREVELVKELGFNGVRVHQKVEDPRFLYWCDRLGLLVWGEMANAYAFSARSVELLTREWLEVLRRDRSHPCIVTWVPLNESWGVSGIAEVEAQRHYATGLYHLTHAVDPTRPVISNDGWEHTESDVWGVHDYGPTGAGLKDRFGTPEAVRRTLHGAGPGRRKVLLGSPEDRGQPVLVTEFGGLSYAPSTGEKWVGYATVESSEALLAAFEDLVAALLESPDVAGFCYTQLTDTEQERNGLLTEDRRFKLAPEAVRAVLRQPAAAAPAEQVDLHRARAQARVRGEAEDATSAVNARAAGTAGTAT
ncbi:glycoside hydrolase family 2 protein [Actinopolymorpha pittospori]